MARPGVITAALALAAALAAGPCAAPALASPAPPTQDRSPSAGDRSRHGGDKRVLFTIADPRITEASGLAVGLRHPDVLYTHNDSSDVPRFFAIGEDGRTLAAFTVAGAEARDWEAMATGRDRRGRPVLYLADIGDNLGGAWPSVSVYRVREPRRLRDATVRATRYRFRYADGARNAEALLVHPRTGRLYVVSREWEGGLYAAPKRLRSGEVNVLRRVAGAPSFVTGGDFAPDGSRFALRTYLSASIYASPGEGQVASVSLPDQPQGESVAYTRDGRALLVGSEGPRSAVWRVPLSAKQTGKSPTPRPVGRSQPGSLSSEDTGGYGGWALLIAGLVAVLVVRRLRSRGDR